MLDESSHAERRGKGKVENKDKDEEAKQDTPTNTESEQEQLNDVEEDKQIEPSPENSEGGNGQISEEENSQISDEKDSGDNENPDENPNNVDEIPNSTPTKEDDKKVEIFYKEFTTLSMSRVSGKL